MTQQTVRPHRIALTAAMEWARKQIKMYPAYSDHVTTLRDEIVWHAERRESVLAELRALETGHATVVTIERVRGLLTEGER